MSKVTFIMMAYNTENYIEQAVRSVLNQTEKDVNLIVRNNGSTDRTGEILDRLASEDNRVYVMHNKTNGITDTGVGVFQPGWWFDREEYLGEYISVLDSDDYIASDFTEKLYNKAVAVDADMERRLREKEFRHIWTAHMRRILEIILTVYMAVSEPGGESCLKKNFLCQII